MDGLTAQKWALEKGHLSLSCSFLLSFLPWCWLRPSKPALSPFYTTKLGRAGSEKIHESSWLHFRDFEALLHTSGLTEMLTWISLSTKTSTLFPPAAVWRPRKWELRMPYLFFDYCGLYIKVLLAFTALLTAACNCLTLASSLTAPLLTLLSFLLSLCEPLYCQLQWDDKIWHLLLEISGLLDLLKIIFNSTMCTGLGKQKGRPQGSCACTGQHWGAITMGWAEGGAGRWFTGWLYAHILPPTHPYVLAMSTGTCSRAAYSPQRLLCLCLLLSALIPCITLILVIIPKPLNAKVRTRSSLCYFLSPFF